MHFLAESVQKKKNVYALIKIERRPDSGQIASIMTKHNKLKLIKFSQNNKERKEEISRRK